MISIIFLLVCVCFSCLHSLLVQLNEELHLVFIQKDKTNLATRSRISKRHSHNRNSSRNSYKNQPFNKYLHFFCLISNCLTNLITLTHHSRWLRRHLESRRLLRRALTTLMSSHGISCARSRALSHTTKPNLI